MNIDFRFYLSLFLRRIHYFLILLAIGAAVGGTMATVLPPVYRAEAVLLVENEQIPSDLAETTVRTEATEQLQIIQQRILTRNSLLEMANRLDIYAAQPGEQPRRLAPDEVVSDLRSRIRIVTTGGGRGGQATVVRVSFEAASARLSATVTNEIVTLILQENVEIRTNVSGDTLEFFTEEVSRLERELNGLNAQIARFQQENLEALPDSLNFRRQQQAAAQERLSQIDREEALIRDRRGRLVELYEATGDIGNLAPVEQLTPDELQLRSLKDQLASALAILSPTNARVRVLEAQIAAQEAKVASQSETEGQVSPGGEPLTAYEIQLADLDGQLEFLTSIRAETLATMESLRTSIEATPGNAITLNTLERNYENLRVQYNQAVANKARAETGDIIEALAKGQRISVIEQAVPPREPESPNRRRIAAAGVGAGLLAGAGFIALLELLNTAVRRPVDLTNKLGITPFGTVPHIRTDWEIVRRRGIIALAFALVLVAIPAGLWVVHTQVMPLDLLMFRVQARLGL